MFIPVSGVAAVFFPLQAGLLVGVLSGLGVILLLEWFDRTLKTVDDVHVKLRRTVLGSLPRFPAARTGSGDSERQLITKHPAAEPAVAAYRSLRANLFGALGNAGHQVVMVTSCIPGEGKSTVSGNLAAVLAETGAKVLLIGCDLRRPTLGEMFGQAREPGLTELLVNGDQSALRSLVDPPIDFMPGGSIPPSPAELLDSKEMRDFLEYARERYDYVIIDAPPVLPITDAQLLAPYCDLRVMVVEPCRTQVRMAQELMANLQSVGQEVDGVILNDKSGLAARYYGGRRQVAVEETRAGTVHDTGRPSNWPARFAWLFVLAVVVSASAWLIWRNDGAGPVASRPPTKVIPPVAVDRQPSLPVAAETGPKQHVPAGFGERPVRPASPSAAKATPAKRAMSPSVSTRPAAGSLRRPTEPLDTAAVSKVSPAPVPEIPTETGSVRWPSATVANVGVVTNEKADGLHAALAAIGMLWQPGAQAAVGGAGGDLVGSLATMGLRASPLGDELGALLQLQTPLLLEVRQQETGTSWIAVVGRKGFKWLVRPQLRSVELLSEADLKRLWTGRGYLPWQDPLALEGLDPTIANTEQIRELQRLLARSGYLQQYEAGVYDRETVKALGHLQAAAGLRVNGRVTPETLVLLYQADPLFRTPKFTMW